MRKTIQQTLAVILTALLLSAMIPGCDLRVTAAENAETGSGSTDAPADDSAEEVSDSDAAPADDSAEAGSPAAAADDNTAESAETDIADLPADDAMAPDETVPEEPSEEETVQEGSSEEEAVSEEAAAAETALENEEGSEESIQEQTDTEEAPDEAAEALSEEVIDEQTLTEEGAKTKANAGISPVISLTHVPAYGVSGRIEGVVFYEDNSSFNPADYRIAVFLQIADGQQYWVKPTDQHPYTDLGPDGSFSAQFITGGQDDIAKILHIMLIPSDHTPRSFPDTQSAALDYVRVTRTDSGEITIDPGRTAPVPPAAQPAINALLPVSGDRIAVDVGFYTDGSRPGSPLSEALIRQQLAAVSAFSNTVRFYASSGELYKAYRIAHEMGFTVVGTANLTGADGSDKAEMDALIEHCSNGYVKVACVGNETLLETPEISPKLTPAELIADIQYVRGRLAGRSIPVTTSDSVDVLLANPSVRNACNLLMPNCYPYWGGSGIDSAANVFISTINELKAVSGGKQVLVSETGWPTAGQTVGGAVPNEANAARYFDAIRKWSLSSGTQVLYFDAADEPWKAGSGGEGSAGAHWGFMTTDFVIKDGYAGLAFFKDKARISVKGAEITGLADKVYTGKAVTQKLTVKVAGKTLTSGTDYTVSYRNNINAGTATVTVTGQGRYTGAASRTFAIKKAVNKITAGNVKKVYSKKARTFALGVKIAGGTPTYKSSSSSVKVSKAGKVTIRAGFIGKAMVTITAPEKKNYKKTVKKITVTVVPTRPKLLSVTGPSATKMKVKWKKNAVASGYQIQYSLKSDFANSRKVTISKNSTVSKTIKNLKKGKKYYVRLRSFKKVGGKKYYSSWSAKKSVKVR